ncbi:uncharacterized protein LOC131997935 [Stomoxys calcitrans]|uniref:uncharacterized protein LOC131997935 n=1 Tax=Stomoxys calcitrans TaxID=35570 RepID=UPI0027E37BBE|nr:uncharacterized protein LOC131997935 [Stomoxys calcitrans]
MSSLERFIRANDKLVNFEQGLTEANISESSIFALEIHRDELKSIWATVKSLYDKCIDHFDSQSKKPSGEANDDGNNSPESDSDSEGSDLDSINARFHASYETYVRIVSKLSAHIHRRTNVTPTQQASVQPSNFHLPACDTESFRGDYQSWPSFRDMFSAIYVNNSSLSKVQKLFHLRKKTEGEAHDIVKKCPLTNNGFDIAWSNLKDRFENKRMLVHSQLRILFNLSTITTESSEDIKCLQRDINSCISSLKLYDIDVSSWDAIFVFVCSTKLPRVTLSLWEQSIKNKKDISKWTDLDSFLSSRYQTLETICEINGPFNADKTNSSCKKQATPLNKKINSNHAKVSPPTSNPPCNLCANEPHTIRKCPKFLNMKIDDRQSCIRRLNLCLNCFAKAHSVKDCKSPHNCYSCGKRHNTLLHRDVKPVHDTNPASSHSQIQNSELQQIQSTIPQSSVHHASLEQVSFPPFSSSASNIQSCFAAHSQNVLLGTALVEISHLGLKYFVRALIDSGSQGTFISERVFNILKLPFQPIEADIAGLNGVTSAKSRKMATFSISPRFDSDLHVNVTALVVPQLSGDLPTSSINPSVLVEFPNIRLADPKFLESSRIDLLIGADIFNNILLDNVRRNICGSLVAQETIFGWIITGPIRNNPKVSSYSTIVSYFSETNLEKQLKRFWEVEEVPQKPLLSESDSFCEKLYSETTKRDSDGRYIVSLPFKESFSYNSPQIGRSRSIASAQFLRNESRLSKNMSLKDEYDSVIQEYLDLGHMAKVPIPVEEEFPRHYYLPHHAVIKPDRTTTKVRVVFNASCPTSSGTSLNDILYPGPVLQNDLTLLLLRWRLYRYVFSADIEKMYRQIRINKDHSCFQRILFRTKPNEQIQDFELQTVTFGVNAAPYLAIRTLMQLAEDCSSSYPLASHIIRDDMYVDDVLTGCHDLQLALKAKDQLISALNSACFPLRKWASNSKEILQSLPKEHILKEDFLLFDDSSLTKTLGVRWNAMLDKFLFVIQATPCKESYTKREVFSEISKIFDPAGWLAPIVVLAKILMRHVWLSKVDWDEKITSKCFQDWKNLLDDFSTINSIQIPRWISYAPSFRIQFHAFCDASENAYAAVIYSRVEDESRHVSVNLLTSKSRVAPVKCLSIPKLELLGATLLAEVVESVIPSMNLPSYEIFKWTDSTIVLAWLRKPACNWKTFVANRVSTISSKVGIDNWFHVDTLFNPADLASRGVYPKDLIENNLWWCGPKWLSESRNSWPISDDIIDDTELEQKALRVHLATNSDNHEIIGRFSSFHRAIRVICYIFRFFHKTHPKHRDSVTFDSVELKVTEVKAVRNRLIVLAQAEGFPEVVEALRLKKAVPKSSNILNLNPFLDENGVIRAFGRLAYSPSLSYDERAPHMGGLWEAGVKSFKTHLKKISGGFTYTFEEFCTLLTKIEACLNSRPISTMSEDFTDLNPLTPGHFLIGGPILAPPEPNYDTHPESVVNRWQRVKVLQQHFCQRWKSEYLKELHKRNKWKNPEKNVEIDSIVVIRDENLPPNEWRIGRVTHVHPGKDKRVRVASVYTSKGVITRPITKLVLLPTQ